ncbi:CHFR isoform 9, partial [Pongo abelii]
AEREQNPRVAPQQCAVCLQPFCHLYWGCTRTGCFGCLAPFCESVMKRNMFILSVGQTVLSCDIIINRITWQPEV